MYKSQFQKIGPGSYMHVCIINTLNEFKTTQFFMKIIYIIYYIIDRQTDR